MKKRILAYAVLLLALSFGALQSYSFLSKQKKNKGHKKVAILQEKPFVIIVPSFNNAEYCERNLHSIFSQKYDNYRLIYIDDASTDATRQKVHNLITKENQWGRTQLLFNEKNQGALANLYYAIHTCKEDEIVITVDGDDALAHDKVLKRLNQAYHNPSVWMTYGNFLDYPTYTQKPVVCKKIPKKVLRNNSFRSHAWVTSHLRTFYAGLFQRIPLDNFLYQGHFFPMAWDLAFMMPMLEISGHHALFIREVLYLYNRENPLNDHKINFHLQEKCQNLIRDMRPHQRLKEWKDTEKGNLLVDLILFSYDRPMQLYALLESIDTHVTNAGRISVIYRTSTSEFLAAYEQVQSRFPHVHFILQPTLHAEQEFRTHVMHTAFDTDYSDASHVAFLVDDMVVTAPIDLRKCAAALEKTHAWGFFLAHGKHLDFCYMSDRVQKIPKYLSLPIGCNAWQFKEGIDDWNYPNSLDFVVYNKKAIHKDFTKINFHNPNTLESAWANRSRSKRAGLFFNEASCVNIPLNLVNPSTNRHMNHLSAEELLKKFEAGLKIDTSPLFRIESRSRHIAYEVTFVER